MNRAIITGLAGIPLAGLVVLLAACNSDDPPRPSPLAPELAPTAPESTRMASTAPDRPRPAADEPPAPRRDGPGGDGDRARTPDEEAARHRPDDTGRNARDNGTAQPTPTDQGESDGDRSITQGIRQAVMSRDDLSMNAKNVKIITREGIVSLRGPVANAKERDAILALAAAQPGVRRVDSQLETLEP